tara:strand:- start:75 stop:836 length:762 start_codon:yes stop_codon:yes gene_type:complete
MKSYSSNLFRAQALILILMMLSTPKIEAFDIDRFDQTNAFVLGKDLVAMPFGMQLLEANNADADELVIGIHGGNSEGYEWIYPLWQLNQEFNQVFFYRWNDKRCANANNANLVNHLDSLLDIYPNVEEIKILSHSYGGTHLLYSLDLIEQRIANKNQNLKIEMHFIASLLSPPLLLRLGCQFKTDFKDEYSMDIYNWKTIQEIDGAFRNYRKDPQEISISSASQTRLPETYNGRKLGHNWSISWVADQISKSY